MDDKQNMIDIKYQVVIGQCMNSYYAYITYYWHKCFLSAGIYLLVEFNLYENMKILINLLTDAKGSIERALVIPAETLDAVAASVEAQLVTWRIQIYLQPDFQKLDESSEKLLFYK